MVAYQGLSRAQLSFDYLHTNSTTHEFLFGALAELLDNARDAQARRMDVFTENNETLRGGYMLYFLDDGTGMDPAEVATVIQFGKSTKRVMDSNMIGQYGNGLKSGAMRIGKDFILFTKQGATMSCLFLSRTFHEEEKIDEVIVPMPSFERDTRHPFGQSPEEKHRHQVEMDLIYKYSPFKTADDFFAQFDRITSDAGTLVIIYHMKLMDNGETELDITTDASDILLAGAVSPSGVPDDSLVPERRSFRAYTSILYAEPKMKIYIQDHKVHTRRLAYTLYKPRLYKYTSTRFKTRSEIKAAEAVHHAKVANEKAREAESKARDLEKKYGQGGPKDKRAQTRQAHTEAFELRQLANIRKKIAEKQQKSLKEPKTINFHFGINLDNRRYDGVFIYNCGRLIKMYEKVGPQIDGGVQCSGVIGVVDVPYLVLEPTHNKQDFADAKEYRHLLKAMGEHMVQYWKDINIAASQGVSKFWESFGYISQNWKDAPSNDPKFVRKRAMQTPILVQCDACLKWRIMPFSSSNISRVFTDDWQCNMNTDITHNRCSSAEQKVPITVGTFKKEVKSAEEQKREIMEEIKKKQEKLGKIEKERHHSSSSYFYEDEDFEESYTVERNRRTSLPASKPLKPIGKASPVQSYKETTTSRPVGKASPVVNNQQQSRRASSQSPASSRSSATASVSKYKSPTPVSRAESRKATHTVEKRVASKPQKHSPAPTVQATKKVYATKRQSTSSSSVTESRNEDKSPEPAKKRRLTSRVSEEGMDVSKDEDASDSTGQSSDMPSEPESTDVGQRVEARVDGKWYPGKVVKVFQKPEGCIKWKVKFDQHPRDKYDKSYDKSSEDLRLLEESSTMDESDKNESQDNKFQDKPQSAEKPAHTQEPAVQKVAPTTTAEPAATDELPTQVQAASVPTPKSTPKATVTPNKAADAPTDSVGEPVESPVKDEKLAQGFRKCLRYFLPPNWPMDKDAINNLGVEELSEFPLDDFFDQYEKGLRNLVGGFQAEAAERARETEATKIKLTELRKLISQLLRSINDEIVVSDTSGEEVDAMLAACVSQAMQDE